ncbi:MAG: glycosyltransferase family 2 protein [Candidatus Moranbacteria bacterium]|nr:glycosyltransferase family 2 protein [Candidatus Moranbacteria bacterium]
MKLTIQIVNFRSRHYLQRCLFSICENLPIGIEAEVLIMNNEKELLKEVEGIAKDNLNLRVIEVGKNIGFGSAHNVGFRESLGKYILFLNPDAKIASNALDKMLTVFAEDEKIGIVGPLLVDSAGKVQPDCFGAHRTPLSTIKNKIFKRREKQSLAGEKVFKTDWVSGGSMMIRRDVFEKMKGFDENFFMYFEDVDLCLRAKKRGSKIMVIPSALVFHESGRSFASEREKKKHYYISQDYYFRKHFGPVSASLVKLIRLPYYIKNVYLNR